MEPAQILLEHATPPDLPTHETVAVRRVVVFGATGRIGREVVAEAASRGWTVRAAARDPASVTARERIVPWTVNLDDEATVEAAIGDCDAVIDCLGPRRNHLGEVASFAGHARAILAAMGRVRVERLVVLSGAGVRLEHERLGPFDRVMRALVGSMAPYVLAAKQVEFESIRKSDVAWTALRPPVVLSGARTGRYRLAEAAPGFGAHISRADVAVALVDQVAAQDWICRAPFLWSPRGRESTRPA